MEKRKRFSAFILGSLIAISLLIKTENAQSKLNMSHLSVSHENIDFQQLLAVYKLAYIKAGFKLKEQLIGEKNFTELVFEWNFPEFANKKGFSSFYIEATLTGKKCTPCLVTHGSKNGLEYKKFKGRELAAAEKKLDNADEIADMEIQKTLGKSLRTMPLPPDPDDYHP